MQTGITAIDSITPIGCGQRELIIGECGDSCSFGILKRSIKMNGLAIMRYDETQLEAPSHSRNKRVEYMRTSMIVTPHDRELNKFNF